MMRLDHIGIAVKSIEKSGKLWEGLFGLKLEKIAKVEHRKVKVAVFSAKGGSASGEDIGDVKIELVEPMSKDSPVSKFLEKRGEGLHHICFEVENLESTLKELKNKGVKIIDKTPKSGIFAKKVTFLHPKTTGSVLIEICEK